MTVSEKLRLVQGLHSHAEMFGFSWDDGSDWTWHDVACKIADDIDAENAELRELVRITGTYCVNGYCDPDDGCPLLVDGKCQLTDRMSELGGGGMTVKTLLIEYDDANGDVMGGYPLRAPAVEVVRCRDCRSYRASDATCHAWQWSNWDEAVEVDPDGFCAWGERKQRNG